MRNWIHKYGITICFDGWDKIAQCPLLHIMFVYLNGDVFIGSIDIIGEWKDTHYICNALVGCIETIGIDNIMQICTNKRNVTNLLIGHFPSLYFQGCVVHYLDLLLEDWTKTTWAKWIVKKTKVNFFSYNNTMC
jgi:hypothetical protein